MVCYGISGVVNCREVTVVERFKKESLYGFFVHRDKKSDRCTERGGRCGEV